VVGPEGRLSDHDVLSALMSSDRPTVVKLVRALNLYRIHCLTILTRFHDDDV
jgi:hypothetical protein